VVNLLQFFLKNEKRIHLFEVASYTFLLYCQVNSYFKVQIFEKNDSLGRKVLLSGGGRCNLTTANIEINSLMKNYPRGSKWLRFLMYEFGPREVFDWFEKMGLDLKIENGRVFPKSNKGKDVVFMFNKVFAENNVEIFYNKALLAIQKDKNIFNLSFENGGLFKADRVILATGGSAYKHTGSTGDGYDFAKSLGHTITDLVPTLTSFISDGEFIESLAGLSFENVVLKIVGKKTYEFKGDFLFTHKGVSGPGIFALSALSAFEICNKDNDLSLFIDFIPDFNYEELKENIKSKLIENSKISLFKVVSKFVSKSFTLLLFKKLNIDVAKRLSELSKKDFNKLIEFLKNFKVNLVSRSSGKEIVTAGGVDLNEVDPKTMESKICPALFFAGEILNVDGFTGGYNLQIAWGTGRIAGKSSIL